MVLEGQEGDGREVQEEKGVGIQEVEKGDGHDLRLNLSLRLGLGDGQVQVKEVEGPEAGRAERVEVERVESNRVEIESAEAGRQGGSGVEQSDMAEIEWEEEKRVGLMLWMT